MGLYTEAADIIRKVKAKKASVKTLVLSKSTYPNKKQLYALVCETLKNTDILKKVEAKVCLLKKEAVLGGDEDLLHVLLYDQLIGRGIKGTHNLRIAIQRYRSTLKAEYKKLREKTGTGDKTKNLFDKTGHLPRYARVNLLKTTVEETIQTFSQEGWQLYSMTDQEEMGRKFSEVVARLKVDEFMLDPHLPDLLVFPPGTDLHDHKLCCTGGIILQDKASCFPAHILSPPEGAVVIDCCAAPGNKASHIASLMRNSGKIFAIDKNAGRLSTMKSLLSRAGVTCADIQHKDFLSLKTSDPLYKNVGYILVDPSCSGSGMVNRINEETKDSADRLNSLSRFQISILKHALSFPAVERVVYSTCSIHQEENETVVDEVLSQFKGKFALKEVKPDWPNRGVKGNPCWKECLRMSHDRDLTNGFFVACFEKHLDKRGEKAIRLKRKGQKTELQEMEESFLAEEVAETNQSKRKKKKSAVFEDSFYKISTVNSVTSDENSSVNMEHAKSDRKKRKKKHEAEKEDAAGNSADDNAAVNVAGNILDLQETSKCRKKKKHKKTRDTEFVPLPTENLGNKDGNNIAATITENLNEINEIKKSKKKKKKHHQKA